MQDVFHEQLELLGVFGECLKARILWMIELLRDLIYRNHSNSGSVVYMGSRRVHIINSSSMYRPTCRRGLLGGGGAAGLGLRRFLPRLPPENMDHNHGGRNNIPNLL